MDNKNIVINVLMESHDIIEGYKIIPRESLADSLARILKEWQELKADGKSNQPEPGISNMAVDMSKVTGESQAKDEYERLTPEERKVKEDQLEREDR